MEKERKKNEAILEEQRLHYEQEKMRLEYWLEQERKKKTVDPFSNEQIPIKDNYIKIKAGRQDEESTGRKIIPIIYKLEDNPRYLENEIQKIRNELLEQQAKVVDQIKDLKMQNQIAIDQRNEALKHVRDLRSEIVKFNYDEDLRRKYIYDVIVDKNYKVNSIYDALKIPTINYDDDLTRDYLKQDLVNKETSFSGYRPFNEELQSKSAFITAGGKMEQPEKSSEPFEVKFKDNQRVLEEIEAGLPKRFDEVREERLYLNDLINKNKFRLDNLNKKYVSRVRNDDRDEKLVALDLKLSGL